MTEQYKLFDTHAHLDDYKFDSDIEETIERARQAGLEHILSVGCWDAEYGFDKTLDMAARHEMVYAAIGVHPHEAKCADEGVFVRMSKILNERGKILAIGEAGLDYHYEHSPKDVQKDVFIRQIRLAREFNLPLIIHSREAETDTLEILKSEGAADAGGVIHCFSGSYEMAKKCLDMGFYISFTGVVTFPKAADIHEVVKKIPVERMLIETDCPYLAPQPHRGKRNEPAFVVETARRIAGLKGISFDDVARITTLNAKELFGIESGEIEAKIAYAIRNSLYLNITNRCTNYCTFCAKHSPAGHERGNESYTVKGHYLRLKQEPGLADIIRAIGDNPARFDEIVFCGYGEPLIRLDVVKEAGLLLKKRGCRIRIDTDGLANLVHGRNVLPDLKFADVVSVSLNAPDSETYQRLIKTPFGDKAFPAIVWFLKEAKKHIPKVIASVVGVPGLDIEACRALAEDEIGVAFRVREYNVLG